MSNKLSEAAEELQFLMEFNSSITQAAAKAMEHLTDFVFLTMGNITLTRRDSYLSHLKNGIKPDTFAALRTGPLHIATLFAEPVVKKAEEEIALYDSKSHPAPATTARAKNRYHPYEKSDRRAGRKGNRTGQPGRTLTADNSKEAEARPLVFHPDLHVGSSSINDSYCSNRVSNQLLTQNFFTDQTLNNSLSSNVKYHVVQYVPSAPGLPQRKGLSPGVSDCHQTKSQLKSVKGASCVTHCCLPILSQMSQMLFPICL